MCILFVFYVSHSILQPGSLYLLYAQVGHVERLSSKRDKLRARGGDVIFHCRIEDICGIKRMVLIYVVDIAIDAGCLGAYKSCIDTRC
jgi:hypothetical protein